MDALIKEYGSIEVEPINVDEQMTDGDMIGSLKVIQTPGHTPGHISLYYEKDKLLLGADTIYKHVFGADGMYVSAPQFSIDPTTTIVSAQRLSKVNFDKLLMAHQDSPLLEGARETVEKLVDESIRKIKRYIFNLSVLLYIYLSHITRNLLNFISSSSSFGWHSLVGCCFGQSMRYSKRNKYDGLTMKFILTIFFLV